MSYIRCLSNPEGLYIWGDGSGNLTIAHTGTARQRARGDQPIKYIPAKIFHGLFKHWLATCEENVSYRGASLKYLRRGAHFKWKLSYGDWSLYMWDVTLNYLAEKNRHRWTRKARLMKPKAKQAKPKAKQAKTKCEDLDPPSMFDVTNGPAYRQG